jgi:hypothetical protein
MTGHIVPVLAGQAGSSSLDQLCARIREAHSGLNAEFSNAIDHAIDAGQALITAHDLTRHRQWAKFLKHCNLGERQAQRHMRLAGLAAANPTCKSDMAGLTIEAAIKKLSPPKARRTPSGGTPATKTAIAHTNAADILAAWDRAPRNERIKAINSIGIEALLAALPRDWILEIEKRLARPRAPGVQVDPACAIPADLCIPAWLRRDSSGSAEDKVPSDERKLVYASSAD